MCVPPPDLEIFGSEIHPGGVVCEVLSVLS